MSYCLFLNCSQASAQARTLRSYLPFLHHGALRWVYFELSLRGDSFNNLYRTDI